MPKIETMYAFVSEDNGPDDEGIIAMKVGNQWMPMVGSDMARVESMKPIAVGLSNALGKRIKIIKFDRRTEAEVIEPKRIVPLKPRR